MSRQPLFPDSTKEAVDLAEMMDGGGHSKQRRENFAKTAQSKFFLQSSTGKSLSEALIFASTNPQYDDRLFIELQLQYIKIPSSWENMLCTEIVFDIQNRLCTQYVLPMLCKNKSF